MPTERNAGVSVSVIGRVAVFLAIFLLSFSLWLLLAGTFDQQELVAGSFAAFAASLLSINKSTVYSGLRLRPLAPIAFVLYLITLIWALIKSNLDMARRVISPSLPIRPELVLIDTQLESELGRLALANSITLTPGTLSVDVEGQTLLVHWIDCPSNQNMQQTTRQIAGAFERHLKGFLK